MRAKTGPPAHRSMGRIRRPVHADRPGRKPSERRLQWRRRRGKDAEGLPFDAAALTGRRHPGRPGYWRKTVSGHRGPVGATPSEVVAQYLLADLLGVRHARGGRGAGADRVTCGGVAQLPTAAVCGADHAGGSLLGRPAQQQVVLDRVLPYILEGGVAAAGVGAQPVPARPGLDDPFPGAGIEPLGRAGRRAGP